MDKMAAVLGPHTERRAFLKAAVLAGGALVCPHAKAGHPQQSDSHRRAADDVAFEGVFITPGATRTLNQRKNIAFLPAAELDQLREAFRVLRANNDQIYSTWV